MVGLNTYINGLDLSALKEYCVNHGRLTQYAKGDYFVKEGEESRYIAYVECGYFNYKVHNFSEGKDYITGFAFEGEFVGDYPNCLLGKTSEVAIVAGTSCKVYQLILLSRVLVLVRLMPLLTMTWRVQLLILML